MAYIYRSGFDVKVSATTLSPTSIHIRSGTIIDSLLNNIIGFSDSIIPKHTGTNYIYATSTGELYNSIGTQLDTLVLVAIFDTNFNLISETHPLGPEVENYDEALTTLNLSIATLEAEMDALQIAGVIDNVLEVKKETLTILGGKVTTAYDVNNVLELYLPNQGELSPSSINSINVKDIIFSDSSYDGLSIEVTYNTFTRV
jgi:hypothetical protein